MRRSEFSRIGAGPALALALAFLCFSGCEIKPPKSLTADERSTAKETAQEEDKAPASEKSAPADVEPEAPEPPHSLVGKQAPRFELETPDGTKVTLADHQGKDIVIVDFWATWCPPCRAGLPIITKVSADYRDRGVKFYAVDVGEEAKDVKDFLETQNLDITALLDKDNEVAKSYDVNGIPQTVLIDKEGKVQVVHVGFSRDLEKRLSGELDEMLAGKDLAGETLKDYASKTTDKPANPAGDEPVEEK